MSNPGDVADQLRRGLSALAETDATDTKEQLVVSSPPPRRRDPRRSPARPPEVRRAVQELLEQVGLASPGPDRLRLEDVNGAALEVDPNHGVVIGRVPGPGRISVLLADVSRDHAAVRHGTGGGRGWYAIDLGSTNGSQLVRGGVMIALPPNCEVELSDGDTVEIPRGTPFARVRIG